MPWEHLQSFPFHNETVRLFVAQENILYDEMTKNLSAAAPGAETEEAEQKFKNYITEYRDRAVKHANQVNKEVRDKHLLLIVICCNLTELAVGSV